MDLSLSENQRMLGESVRSFMERRAPRGKIVALQQSETGYEPETWKTIAELGWLGLLIPERYAGGGASLTDAAILYQELGRGPLPGPFFSSGVLSALVLLEAGTEKQRRRWLPEIASGRQIFTVAISEPARSWGAHGITLAPERRGQHFRLNGTKLFVSDAVAASHFIVAVRTGPAADAIALIAIERSSKGISTRLLPGFLGWQAEVTFDNVEIPADALLGGDSGEHAGWAALTRAMERALPVLCAYQVGSCQMVYEMSVEYSQTRIQFGVPIGRFQRVQDHIVRLVNHLDAARWATYEALWKLDSGRPAAAGVHLAKAVTAEAHMEACNAAHEVHAGIGSSNEYGLVAHTQLSRTLFNYLGDPRWHKRQMADALAW
ncbi:MAG TPA: acyl-CoA dehydrogenase family protein [Candidatus Binataceae bacterium]|nr:acyl-CoA dehydrogenase family protein [Candidatus Binataceae bacterium]